MTMRNRHLEKQLRAALRRSRWDAATLTRRVYVSPSDMALALVDDTSLTLRTYELVTEALEVNLEFVPWRADGGQPTPGRLVETLVDRARARFSA